MVESFLRWPNHLTYMLENSPSLVAFVGSGGKTTLLYAIGQNLKKCGKRVLLSTTTRMYPPAQGEADLWLGENTPPPFEDDLLYLWGAGIDQEGKVIGLKPSAFKPLLHNYDYILVEADGSRGLPLKFWRREEPVLPEGVTDVFCLASLRGIGQPIKKVLHGYEAAQEIFEVPEVIDNDLWNALRLYQVEFVKELVSRETRITLIDRVSNSSSNNLYLPYTAMSWNSKEIIQREASPKIGVVVLAAGAGSRFGGGKLTASFAGMPVLSWILKRINSTSLHPKIVVGGADEDIRELAMCYGFNWLHHEQWAEGMGSSLKKGIEWIRSQVEEEDLQGILVMLGDMPLIERRTLNMIISIILNEKPQVAYPVCEGRQGHPVYFSRDCFADLSTITGDIGGKVIINKFRQRLIETNDKGVLLDIDKQEDIKKAEHYMKKK